jgi:hypothetical protein
MLSKTVKDILTELKIGHKFYIVLSIQGFCLGYMIGFLMSYFEIL